jgi:CRISPR/Cas system CSM-associated protein Csm3 (group 7 of RAMP superfamily)
MSNIKYKIEFFTDWHCGSGLSSGADLDLLVIKDKDRLPFVPGKTIKGLVREAAEEILKFRKQPLDEIKNVFGEEGKSQGRTFFTNAALPEDMRKAIIKDNLQEYLYRSVASTAIDDNGIAKEHSLRKMQVTVPCTLVGEILDVPEDFVASIENGLKFIKRLGQNRNRGLGRCSFQL